MIGLVFSCYSVAMVIFSPLFKRLLDTYGSKKVLIVGLLSEAIAMIVFGLFDYIMDPDWYVGASMACRFLEGFGNGCLNSGSANLLMTIFPAKKLAKLNGILQTFTGLGMLMGPIMGSVLFQIGGF
jgi:MFS family permease